MKEKKPFNQIKYTQDPTCDRSARDPGLQVIKLTSDPGATYHPPPSLKEIAELGVFAFYIFCELSLRTTCNLKTATESIYQKCFSIPSDNNIGSFVQNSYGLSTGASILMLHAACNFLHGSGAGSGDLPEE